MPPRVLIALDKFKDSLTASAAVATVAATLRELHPGWTLDLAPLADGGEGFAEILTRAAAGRIEEHRVTGPRGEPVRAAMGFAPARAIPIGARGLLRMPDSPQNPPDDAEIAVVEMAAASGLALLAPDLRDPWQTTTLGTGELLRIAATRGAAAILLGVGGSATHDLGLGALSALGLECLGTDRVNGTILHPPVPARWNEITHLAGGVSASLPPVYIACDVVNPLLGPRGAATVYAPQKGLRPADLATLETQSARLARMLCAHCGRPASLIDTPGGGAAGGIAFGLLAACDAIIVPGFDLVSAWLDLDARIAAADLVFTGEGRFDESSLEGKGPGAIAARALALGKEVHVFAGQIGCPKRPGFGSRRVDRAGLSLHAITPDGVPLDRALREGAQNLASAVRRVFEQ